MDAQDKPAKPLNVAKGKRGFQTVITEPIKKQVAALTAMGMSMQAIGRELKIDPDTVGKVQAMDDVREAVTKLGDDALSAARAHMRIRIAGLADAVYNTIKYQLEKKHSIQAAALALKTMGMEQPTENSGASGNIIVHLPGAPNQPVTINAESKPVKE